MAEDTYFHLHDEDFDKPYMKKKITAENHVIMADRKTTSLDGEWYFTLDLHEEGLRQKWYSYQQLPMEKWDVPRDYDPFMGETFPIPGCWNTAKPQWYYFEGAAWYSKRFNRQELPKGKYVMLRIGAAANEAFVFINGQCVGFHQGASTPFYVDIASYLTEGENTIQFCVRNHRRREDVPMRHTDWFNYGGIHRSVCVFSLPEVYIKDAFVSLIPHTGLKKISAEILLNQPTTTQGHISIPELSIDMEIPIIEGKGKVELKADINLWSPHAPKLYDVTLSIKEDCISESIGFREITAKGTNLFLNGEPIFLKGISVHEDDEEMGRVTNENDIYRRFQHAKELGCNFVRLAHYPHDERAMAIADSIGMLLWNEIPVYWAIDFSNEQTLDNACNQLSEMILRDRNRASVIFWSVGNENADTDIRLHFMKTLVEQAKQLDKTRLVTAACLIDFENLRIKDRLSEYLDVIGINEYYGWYIPQYTDLIQICENSAPDKPVVISELGASALIGPNAPKNSWFSEEMQVDVYENQAKILPSVPALCGVTPWILYDFRAERRQNVAQNGYNRKGLIAADKKTKKKAFHTLANFYKQSFPQNNS